MFQINKSDFKEIILKYQKWIALLFVLLIVAVAGNYIYNSLSGVITKTSKTFIAETYYTCPMHPSVISDKPGSCPVCNMRLVKKTRDPKHGAHGDIPAGTQTVTISPLKQVLANVAVTEVKSKPLTKTIRTVAIVASDQSLYVAQQEYLSAFRVAKSTRYSGDASTKRQGEEFLKAARERLKLMGISESEIKKIEKKEEIDRSLYFPKPGDDIWINAEIFEFERKWITEKLNVDITVDSYPNTIFKGKIMAITPTLDPVTRTFKVRIAISKPKKTLSPDMFAHAKLKIPAGEKLSIPASSVIDTGERKNVWVEIEKGKYSLKKIILGDRVDENFIVLDGLKEGDKVVSQGGFLLDSEAELRSFGETSEGEHQH